MADALKMTLYGSLGSGESIPLTDAELWESLAVRTAMIPEN